MGALADLLAKNSDDSGPASPGGSDEPDHQAMAEASVKAFFEAGKKGDYKSATEHLSSAMEHCEQYDSGSDEPDGDMGEPPPGKGHAILLMPHPGGR